MKIFNLLILFFLYPLYGCGENINFSVGATKGGSGTGSLPAPSSGEIVPPFTTPLPSEGDDDDDVIYYIKSQGMKENICENIKITLQPLERKTLSVVAKDQNILIPPSSDSEPANLYFEVKIKNSNNTEAYEYYHNCQPNIKLQNQYNVMFESNQNFICLNDEMTLMIQPNETKVFTYKVTIPQLEHTWNILYTPIFSIGNLKKFHERTLCQTLSYEIKVIK
ncbi:hypothetical protein ACF8D3_03290 [Acinetobacter sp. YQ_14]|uniref:hypothetical protein n=1 Tax=Acinetobacter sp. YQ_14 TaxID=3367236 RepID=UPI00370C7DD6